MYAAVSDIDDPPKERKMELPIFTITAILSTAFAYGCILTTLFIITLPVECERIHLQHPDIPKSVALGIFVAIAGVTQLISPLVGRLSDSYTPPVPHALGQRLPYLTLGSVATVTGLLGQMMASAAGFWVRYSFAFFLQMIGRKWIDRSIGRAVKCYILVCERALGTDLGSNLSLFLTSTCARLATTLCRSTVNIIYAMMIALIPDQVPKVQTGIANGILALLLVMGSLFGFGLFHSILGEKISSMYALYTCIVIFTSILTGTHAHDRDADLAYERMVRRRRRRQRLGHADSGVESGFESGDDEIVSDEPEPTPSADDPPLMSSDAPQWKKVAKKASQSAKRFAKKAKEIVLTPTVILHSMLVDPFQHMDWSQILQAYTIDIEEHHDFFIVTVSRLCYYW
jgi:hypothetical protein